MDVNLKELENCPFCGCRPMVRRKGYRLWWIAMGKDKISCSNNGCGAHFSYWHPSEWNRRWGTAGMCRVGFRFRVIPEDMRERAWNSSLGVVAKWTENPTPKDCPTLQYQSLYVRKENP